MEWSAFTDALAVASQLETRVVAVLRESPWFLAQATDPRNTLEKQEQVRQQLFSKNPCDLDPACLRIVQKAIAGDRCAADRFIEGTMETVSKHAPGTNMSLERLLALIRAAAAGGCSRKSRAACVLINGLLTQLMRMHLDAGLPDKRGRHARPSAPTSPPH